MAVEIKIVNNRAMLRRFVEFPNRLYRGNAYYVPVLIIDDLATLDAKKNPASDFCEQQLFLAYRNKKIVGRIAAIINHKANKIWNQRNARFGFLDFIDDHETVDALFHAAENWGRAKGMHAIQGPMGFTDLDQEGMLVWGYDRMATMMARYNFPYYSAHLERLGYEKEADWKEFLIEIPPEVPERHRKVAEVVTQRYGLKLLKFEGLKHVKPYLYKVFDLLNRAYAPLYGFSELSQRQIDYYVKMFAPLLNWDLVSIVIKEETDEVVGFGIGMPNMSLALQRADGKLFPWGWRYLVKAMKGKSSDTVDLMLVAVAPEMQGKGINAIIFNDFIPAANKLGFKLAESNPELETNNKVQSQWEGLNYSHHKTRRAFIKKL